MPTGADKPTQRLATDCMSHFEFAFKAALNFVTSVRGLFLAVKIRANKKMARAASELLLACPSMYTDSNLHSKSL